MIKRTATKQIHISSRGLHINPGKEFYVERAKGAYSNCYLVSFTKSRSGVFATVDKSTIDAASEITKKMEALHE